MFRPLNRLASPLLLLALAVGSGGCSSAKPESSSVTRAVVQLTDLGVTAPSEAPNTVTHVETQASIGRFPAGVSVARIAIEDLPDGQPGGMVIDMLTDPEALYWNELFDSVGKIREVTVIDPQSVPQRHVTIPQLLASSRRQKCRLCVIYGQNDVAANVSRVVGAVYDTDTSELIGTAYAEEVIDPNEKRPAPPDYPSGDKRNMDAHWLASRKFESLIREFVLDLIQRDREPGAGGESATQPATTGPASIQSGHDEQ